MLRARAGGRAAAGPVHQWPLFSPHRRAGACSAAVLADGQLLTWGQEAAARSGGQGIPRPLSGLGEHVVVQARLLHRGFALHPRVLWGCTNALREHMVV